MAAAPLAGVASRVGGFGPESCCLQQLQVRRWRLVVVVRLLLVRLVVVRQPMLVRLLLCMPQLLLLCTTPAICAPACAPACASAPPLAQR